MLIAFEYMITDVLSDKKLNPIATKLLITRQKTKLMPFFFRQSYSTKYYALFYYKNLKQIRTSTNCI